MLRKCAALHQKQENTETNMLQLGVANGGDAAGSRTPFSIVCQKRDAPGWP